MMTTSTKTMLRAMQSSTLATDLGDMEAAIAFPTIDSIEQASQLTPSPSMSDLLNYCLGPKKAPENTPLK